MRRRLPVLALVLLTACVSSGRVKALEKRIADLEQRETQRDLEVNGTMLRIEAQLAALAANLGRLSDLGVADLVERLAVLDERVEKLAARPTPPPRRPAPDPSKVYAVAVAGAPVRGKADALVTIVKAGEYACPFCEKARPTMDQILADYGDKVRLVHRDFVVHPQTATIPAQAGCAAHRQGKFWEMDALLWEKVFMTRQFEQAHIETLAGELGLDLDRFRADLSGPCVAYVQDGMAELTRVGVGATPAFFVNGRFISGAQPYPAFKVVIDEELKKAEERVKKGTKAKKYYDEWVVKKGLTRLEPAPAAP